MTIIASFEQGDDIFIAHGDATAIDGIPVRGGFDPWIITEGWSLGITGKAAVFDLVMLNASVLANETDSPREILANLRELLLENEIGSKESDDAIHDFGINSLLVRPKVGVFDLGSCLSPTKIEPERIWANGSGYRFAIGAGVALQNLSEDLGPEDLLARATAAAIECDENSHGSPSVRRLGD